jgi:threonine dehydratase
VANKLENLQLSGSFKPRGGLNKILKTQVNNPHAEYVAPTAGVHGVGLSFAGKILGTKIHIMMPSSADPDRINDIKNNGASIQFFDSVPEAINPKIKIIGVQQDTKYCRSNLQLLKALVLWLKKNRLRFH